MSETVYFDISKDSKDMRGTKNVLFKIIQVIL